MSRSFRKTPVVKDSRKGGKKFANRKVRRSKDIPNGKQYRKFYNSWDISDWCHYETKEQWIRNWQHNRRYFRYWKDDFDAYMKHWYTSYYWK